MRQGWSPPMGSGAYGSNDHNVVYGTELIGHRLLRIPQRGGGQAGWVQIVHCWKDTVGRIHQPMLDPAQTVITRFGGAGPLARRLDLDRSAVHRWALPKSRSGTGGLIPARHHLRLLALAAAEGIALSAADLVGAASVIADPPQHCADDG